MLITCIFFFSEAVSVRDINSLPNNKILDLLQIQSIFRQQNKWNSNIEV